MSQVLERWTASLRLAARHLVVPVSLAAFLGSQVFRAEGQAWLTDHAVRLDYPSLVLLTLLAGVWLLEQLIPARAGGNGGVLRDLLYLFVVTQFSALFIKAASSGLDAWGIRSASSRFWPHDLPFAAKVVLAFFAVEFMSYWTHRAAHRVPLLWQFHSTHHVITELTGLKALRTHPVDNVVFYVTRNVPLLLLGAGADELLVAATLGALLGVLAHANLDARGLGWVVNLPGFHAVHHSAELDESNSNFGCHTIVWDRLFGTFRAAPRGTLRIGVEPVGPRSLWRELFWPFYRRVS